MWVRRYAGPGNGSDVAYAAVVDARGNVYVGGGSTGSQSDYDFTTIRYDGDGVLKWVSRYNGPGNGSDEASDLAVGVDGNVYAAGYRTGTGGDKDYLTISYGRETGSELMLAAYDGTAGADDLGKAIALGGGRSAIVTGVSSALSQADNAVTIGYSAGEPPELIAALIDLLDEYDLEPGIENSLTVKLHGAPASVTAANVAQRRDAVRKLEAFINECLAKRGKKLTPEQAERLVLDANCVIRALQQ